MADPKGPADRLQTATEVSRRLRFSKQHVYYLAASGQLPSIKLKGAVRFRGEDVERFIEDHRRKAG